MDEAADDPESDVARAIRPRPHELRHSYVTDMRAAGIDDPDLAAITGHTVLTMLAHHAHAKHENFDAVRGAE